MFLIMNKEPAKGCLYSRSVVRPVFAEVTYKSWKSSPPKQQEVTLATGKGIDNIFFPDRGFQRVICQPSQCAIHNIPSLSMVTPSGDPSFSGMRMAILLLIIFALTSSKSKAVTVNVGVSI